MERKDVKPEDCWDLSRLFESDQQWEEAFQRWESRIEQIKKYRGTLGIDADHLAEVLTFMRDFQMQEERLAYYAHLRTAEDVGNSTAQERFSRYMAAATRAEAEASYQTPEIQAIPDETMTAFLEDSRIKEFSISLKKTLRYKPHILSEAEEKILAMQEEVTQALESSFSSLTNADMDFGTIDGKPLTNATFGLFQIQNDREIRRRSYEQFYRVFEQHKHTLADLYKGSVQKDIFTARVRRFESARQKSLFRDDVSPQVYDNLIALVRKNLPLVHRYYSLRRRTLGVDKLRQYDRMVPLVAETTTKIPYDEGVILVLEAVKPLGEEYRTVLRKGLTGGWVDRYENKGKRSGAFSAGSYLGDPYILLNYQEDNLRDLFTLAHEAGHSMHSWYSVKENPFQHYNYTIFEAEVASTFNEQLLARHLLEQAESPSLKRSVVNRQIDDFLATMVRQTMFAEFERETHRQVEEGRPLTLDSLRSLYRELLKDYFGPEAVLEEVSDLECLRIPHFYRAFYVYKYATGLAASLALSRRVLEGGPDETQDYLNFLKSGGSRFPLESLKTAGVDMSTPEPLEEAFRWFEEKLNTLEELLKNS